MPKAHPTVRRAATRVTQLLASHSVRATTTELRFTDENGPKGGPDVRCALTVKIPRRPPLHVAEVGTSPRLAFDAAFTKLERRIARVRESDRESRRHPKKYFVAARGWRAS
jgi:ribosome-associated translation inhibitor RaiA